MYKCTEKCCSSLTNIEHKAIAHAVLSISELSCCWCACKYVLNCTWHCLLWSIVDPVNIACGFDVWWIPSSSGKQFKQKNILYDLTFKQYRSCLKGMCSLWPIPFLYCPHVMIISGTFIVFGEGQCNTWSVHRYSHIGLHEGCDTL